MSPEDKYLKWRARPPVGCVFARLMARHRADYGQKVGIVHTKSASPAVVSAEIADLIDQFLADSSVSAATLLFPDLVELESLTRIALALKPLPNWYVTTSAVMPPPDGDMVAVHVVRDIPFGAATCPSEALVLGPFDNFPPTRRAPVTALEIFVGEPMTHDPKSGAPTTKANLAHAKLDELPDQMFKSMWASSLSGLWLRQRRQRLCQVHLDH
jgi:hypothetical protein